MSSDEGTSGPATTVSPATGSSAAAVAPTTDEINAGIRYTLFSVFSRVTDLPGAADVAAAELAELVEKLAADDVVVRGIYDLTGMRADADLMVWWHASTAEQLQAAVRDLRRTAVGSVLNPAWSAMGLHRPAEFNRRHVPAFLAGLEARDWVAVYPFVRSYEWYLLPEEERRGLLVEHGVMGRDYDQVLSNTVASFALGDYEWLLALESADLHDIVDLMRHLRSSGARRHVREEIPFFTGRRVDPAAAVEALR